MFIKKYYKSKKIVYELFGIKFTFKNKNAINIYGQNNHIYYVHENNVEEEIFNNPKGININIWGDNNVIKFSRGNFINTEFVICSNNNRLDIKPSLIGSPIILTVEIKSGDNQVIEIGKNFSCAERCEIWSHEEASHLQIGDNVMCSKNVSILTSDAHCIFDKTTQSLINKRTGIMSIGNNVWLGKNVMLLKNAQIAANTVVGGGRSGKAFYGAVYSNCGKSSTYCA